MSAPKVRHQTVVVFVAQVSFAHGIEWEAWEDVADGEDDKLDDAIGKIELFHHFMEHGRYPDPYNMVMETPLGAIYKARHAHAVEASKRQGYKVRTRIIKRTIVATITEEEVDKPMLVQHGAREKK